MLKYLWKNKLILIFLLLAIWLIPNVIGLSEQSQTESIITAVGIDKIDNEYEVSLQYIVPSAAGGPEGLKLTTQKGKTVGETIEKIKLQLGKLSGFAHCRFLAFNDKAGEENITEMLDFLLRRKTNTNNIILINTPDSSKELLSLSSQLNSDLYSYLNNNGFSTEFGEFYNLKTIGDFYDSYFSPVKCISINRVKIKEENSQDSSGEQEQSKESSSSANAGGEAQSSTSSQSKKEFENKGELIIIKNAKKLLTLNEEQSDNLSWFNPEIKQDQFSIENYSEGHLENSSILFNVSNKLYSTNVYFLNNTPTMEVNLKLYVRVGEVVSKNLKQSDYEGLQRNYSSKLKKAMNEKLLSSLKQAEEHFKQNEYDVISCFDTFFKFKNKELKNYLKSTSVQEFIKNVKFVYNIEFVQGH